MYGTVYEFEPVVIQPRPVAIRSATWRRRLRRTATFVNNALIAVFALIGVLFTGVFIAMHFGLLNVRGSAMSRDQFYESLPKSTVAAASVPHVATATGCLGRDSSGAAVPVCAWNRSPQWNTVRAGIEKDQAVIAQVSQQTGVSSRMIVAAVAPEQLRLFASEREMYKKYFEPLKVLGSMSDFSLGIAGFKQETASRVEQYTIDTNSPFYSGPGMASLVAYPAGARTSGALYRRLTDSKNHYYSYLYAALFVKEIQAQWLRQGYDISGRPDVLSTLFNIGFDKSHPNGTPQIGGTPVTLNGTTYSFGELGTDFYLSDEMTAIFPRS